MSGIPGISGISVSLMLLAGRGIGWSQKIHKNNSPRVFCCAISLLVWKATSPPQELEVKAYDANVH
jgi:hypothetical protein